MAEKFFGFGATYFFLVHSSEKGQCTKEGVPTVSSTSQLHCARLIPTCLSRNFHLKNGHSKQVGHNTFSVRQLLSSGTNLEFENGRFEPVGVIACSSTQLHSLVGVASAIYLVSSGSTLPAGPVLDRWGPTTVTVAALALAVLPHAAVSVLAATPVFRSQEILLYASLLLGGEDNRDRDTDTRCEIRIS